MGMANLLHKSKLEAFKSFLSDKGLSYRQGKGDFQVIQICLPTLGWQPIFERLDSKEHYSVPRTLVALVREFIDTKPGDTTPVYSIGEIWYIKHIGASAVSKVRIKNITDRTVELERIGTRLVPALRYLKEDIEFIEHVMLGE